MTDKQTPPDWILIEAAKRCGWAARNLASVWDLKQFDPPFRALCDMIERYEARPVDRKVLCAREAVRQKHCGTISVEQIGVCAIELWEEGYGK